MIEEPMHIKTRRGNRSDRYFEHLCQSGNLAKLIDHLLPNYCFKQDIIEISNHDDRAAFVCAVTALCIVKNTFTAVGDKNGWIILPPRKFIQEWAFTDLALNAAQNTAWLVVH